jgi:hypothetical protein
MQIMEPSYWLDLSRGQGNKQRVLYGSWKFGQVTAMLWIMLPVTIFGSTLGWRDVVNLDELVCTSTLTQELTIDWNSWCCLTMLLDSKLESLAIFSRLKILNIRWSSFPQAQKVLSCSDLKQLRQLKILRVAGIFLVPVLPDTTLPLCSTLRGIYLDNAPTEWMSGHVFMNLATLSIVIQAGYQGFHFTAGQGRNTFPCLCTIRLLHRRSRTFPLSELGSTESLTDWST